MPEDYYDILNVDRSATQEEIKKSYRKLAHQHHPDKDGGDEEKFKQVNEAYQVLSDEQKKSQYDQVGQSFDGAGANYSDYGNFSNAGFGNFSDIIDQFFTGNRGTTPQTRRGHDVMVDVSITFAESAAGVSKEVNHRLYQACSHCHGNGAEPGTPIESCETCEGRGSVSKTQQTPLGVFAHSSVCPTCKGEGKISKEPCKTCRGDGRELSDRSLSIDVPAGIADGQTLRISNKGEAPTRGGVSGDLFATIHVEPHATLVRDGDNIRSEIHIPFIDAVLGSKISVETLTGSQELEVPAGTQPGTERTFTGHGFPSISGGPIGDLIVKINVDIPKKVSRKQRKLLEEFKNAKKSLF